MIGVVQEALRQRRARQPLAGKAAQFVVTNAVGDDVGDDGQPCAAQAIDVITRKARPRFSGRKSYQPRRLSKDVALFIFRHDRFPEPEKIKRVRRDCRPWRTQCLSRKSTSSRLRGPPASPSYSSGGIGGGSDFEASGPERMSGLGVPRSEAGIGGASVGGAAIAGSGSDAHARPCLKLSRRVLATRASSMSVRSAGRQRRLSVGFGAIQHVAPLVRDLGAHLKESERHVAHDLALDDRLDRFQLRAIEILADLVGVPFRRRRCRRSADRGGIAADRRRRSASAGRRCARRRCRPGRSDPLSSPIGSRRAERLASASPAASPALQEAEQTVAIGGPVDLGVDAPIRKKASNSHWPPAVRHARSCRPPSTDFSPSAPCGELL